MSRLDEFYAILGFGVAKADLPDVAFKGCAYGGSRATFHLTWRNRLLLLWSGKITVDTAHMMDRMPKIWHSNAAFSVLPPNFRLYEERDE